jgi:HEAT repeat protein
MNNRVETMAARLESWYDLDWRERMAMAAMLRQLQAQVETLQYKLSEKDRQANSDRPAGL